nr:hypothetical protein GCM10017745_39240 [Saccharothrix mutabilis subsp. capreolus]
MRAALGEVKSVAWRSARSDTTGSFRRVVVGPGPGGGADGIRRWGEEIFV